MQTFAAIVWVISLMGLIYVMLYITTVENDKQTEPTDCTTQECKIDYLYDLFNQNEADIEQCADNS